MTRSILGLSVALACRGAAAQQSCAQQDRPTLGNVQLQGAFSRASKVGLTQISEDDKATSSNQAAAASEDQHMLSLSAISSRTAQLQQAVSRMLSGASRMEEQWDASVSEIDTALHGFMNHLGSSEDSCSSQLLNYKRQLHQVHQEVTSLTVQVNSTKSSVYIYEKECREKNHELSVLGSEIRVKVRQCVTRTSIEKKTLTVLRSDMRQMKKIARTHVHLGGYTTHHGAVGMTGHGGTYAGGSARGGDGHSGGAGWSGSRGSTRQHRRSSLAMTSRGRHVSRGAASSGYHRSGRYHRSSREHHRSSRQHRRSSRQYRRSSRSETATGGHSYGSSGATHGQTGGYTRGPAHGHSVLETASKTVSDAPSSEGAASDAPSSEERVSTVRGMVQRTKDMAAKASTCMAQAKPQVAEESDDDTAEVFLQINETAETYPSSCAGKAPGSRCSSAGVSGTCRSTTSYGAGELKCTVPAVPDGCKQVVIELEHSFTTAYVSLTRLIEEYEVVSHSTVCEDSVRVDYQKNVQVIQTEAGKICRRVQHDIATLDQHKLQLTSTSTNEHKMQQQIQVLSKECGSLTQTENYLNSVTYTISALGNCPGLNGRPFAIPAWTGRWVTFKQERSKTDKWNDEAMLHACQAANPGYRNVRPAEVSEIDAFAIERMPRTNTAQQPLLGACPMCQGDDNDGASKESHGRLCWDSSVKLDRSSRRGDCAGGDRALMCVYEKDDYDPGPGPIPPTPAP